ncbi:hypothetical protein GN244_ATG12407 [Phytophthora infestans]|nr:hypothetical protein GN244_ATG12407 [Phytophthora infestans]
MGMDVVPPPAHRPRLQQWNAQPCKYEHAGSPSSNSSSGDWGKHQQTEDMISALREKMQAPGVAATSESTSRDGQLKAMVDLIIADKLRLRELRRVRQIRYRKKKDDYADRLDEGNKQLQVEIEKHKERRRLALAAVPCNGKRLERSRRVLSAVSIRRPGYISVRMISFIRVTTACSNILLKGDDGPRHSL